MNPNINNKHRNPVTEARRRMNVSKAEFARRTGATYDSVMRAEAGYVRELQKAMLDVLERLGYERDFALQAYEHWRESLLDPPSRLIDPKIAPDE